jgi:hypothetical protein
MALGAPGDLSLENCDVDANTIQLGGRGGVEVVGSSLHATGGANAILIGPGERDAVVRTSTLTADDGDVLVHGAANAIVEDSALSSGASADRRVTIAPGTDVTILDSVVSAPQRPVTVAGGGNTMITGSELTAGHGLLTVGPRFTNTITGSTLTVKGGDLHLVGFDDNRITDSTLVASNGDVLISQNGDAVITRGAVRASDGGGVSILSGGGSEIRSARVSAQGVAGLLMYAGHGADSRLLNSRVTADELTVGAFGDTTVRKNKLQVPGPIDISASGSCVTANNTPNVACH